MAQAMCLKVKTKVMRGALLLICVFSFVLEAEQAQSGNEFSFALGRSHLQNTSQSSLRTDFSWNQGLLDETLYLKLTLQTLSILSQERSLGIALRLSPRIRFLDRFEGGPILSFEREVLRKHPSVFLGARMSFESWNFRLENVLDFSLLNHLESRYVRMRQDILMSTSSSKKHSDWMGVFFQFEEELGTNSINSSSGNVRIFGVSFVSSF